jgi:hypothetical protein
VDGGSHNDGCGDDSVEPHDGILKGGFK